MTQRITFSTDTVTHAVVQNIPQFSAKTLMIWKREKAYFEFKVRRRFRLVAALIGGVVKPPSATSTGDKMKQ